MSEENQPKDPPAGDPPGAGGTGGDGGGDKGGSNDPPKHVPYDTHRRLLDEKKKDRSELDALRAEKAERERKEAEAKGEFEKLLNTERSETAKLKAKLEESEAKERDRRKLGAILNGAGGNIDRKWFPTISAAGLIDKVKVDPDTGEIDSASVAEAVKQLKTSYPEIVQAKGGPKTPNADPSANGKAGAGKILYSEYVKLSSREMDKWKPSQIVDD